MRIDQADASAIKRMGFDQDAYFFESRNLQCRQVVQGSKLQGPLSQRTKGQLRNDEGVHHDFIVVQKIPQRIIRNAKMIHPDCCVGQDHPHSMRRRGMSGMSGEDPPKAANLRAASL